MYNIHVVVFVFVFVFYLKDYLREQPDNIKSVNLVAETTRFLNILYSSVNSKTIPLITQLFDTLVEFTSVSSAALHTGWAISSLTLCCCILLIVSIRYYTV